MEPDKDSPTVLKLVGQSKVAIADPSVFVKPA